jgi:hypothetical protein
MRPLLPIHVTVLPGPGVSQNLVDKARLTGIPVWTV